MFLKVLERSWKGFGKVFKRLERSLRGLLQGFGEVLGRF